MDDPSRKNDHAHGRRYQNQHQIAQSKKQRRSKTDACPLPGRVWTTTVKRPMKARNQIPPEEIGSCDWHNKSRQSPRPPQSPPAKRKKYPQTHSSDKQRCPKPGQQKPADLSGPLMIKGHRHLPINSPAAQGRPLGPKLPNPSDQNTDGNRIRQRP